uniref:putative toxin-antitoxin system toxin component, PIN family n=1 Tax=Thermococcus sp. IRI33 TaxID=1197733 RepID=UPI001866CD13|nr:putative toxin-antitoxin system toxin component, PIN family [Thermococcus sp. IRI33]
MSSALGGPAAAPAIVIRLMIEGRLVNFASNQMLERLEAKLSSRRIQRYLTNKSSGQTGELLRYKPYAIMAAFEKKSVIIDPEIWVDASDDEEDNEVLSVACDAGAEYVITQDQADLISLRDPVTKEVIIEDENGNEVCRIKILTPREFLEELKEKKGWVI